MIGIIFEQMDGKMVEIRLSGNDIRVRHQDYGASFFPLKIVFEYNRCLKVFPEIEGSSSWRDLADELFKKNLKEYKTQKSKAAYIVEEMQSQGFKPLYSQEEGHRTKKFNGKL